MEWFEKILVIGRKTAWIEKLAEVLHNRFTDVVLCEPEDAFRTFAHEEPNYVIVCDCDDSTASTPEAHAYRNVKILAGDHAVLRCGKNGDGEDFLKKPFSIDQLIEKIRVFEE